MNKFNAVVRDSFQAKNNETLAFDFYIHKLFLERDHLRNTSSNCLLCRVVKHQYPELQFTRKQSTRGPQNAFSLVPSLKFTCWKERFLPLEKTHTKWRNLLCLGNGLVMGPKVKYSCGQMVGGCGGRLYCSNKGSQNLSCLQKWYISCWWNLLQIDCIFTLCCYNRNKDDEAGSIYIFLIIMAQGKKKWWTTHWLLKFILKSDIYHFCSFSLAKVSHITKCDSSGSGKCNSSLGRSFKHLETII